ncbi:hypothetical protein ISU10_13185 [Nocardioides agariphilus]|jgi:hypothetical protein|uniref:Uncharacterized protein n=1 Tax=Nocardioides agariphilus TaxID=433664 RepID=A0A930YN17_9ACTN|nr:hypothetical protein [Nocardioides agariphilus]MBF4768719.1 hypothetical protein [Nocardioides agariphilus]
MKNPGQKLKSGLIALAVGIVLVAALDWAAAAATGRSMILGQWNQADHSTTLKNTKSGPALDLRASGPALKVSNGKKIAKLNADQLDGLDSTDLQSNRNVTYQWSATNHTGGFTQAIPDQPAGSYVISFSLQMNGAQGTEADPNVINCRIDQTTTVGIDTLKARLADTQLPSIDTIPTLNGSNPVVLATGDKLTLACTMTRNGLSWTTPVTQPITVNLLRVDGSTVTMGGAIPN